MWTSPPRSSFRVNPGGTRFHETGSYASRKKTMTHPVIVFHCIAGKISPRVACISRLGRNVLFGQCRLVPLCCYASTLMYCDAAHNDRGFERRIEREAVCAREPFPLLRQHYATLFISESLVTVFSNKQKTIQLDDLLGTWSTSDLIFSVGARA